MSMMANKEDHPPRGNEWEVVSLTSSAYAAAPGPCNIDAYYKTEASRDLFMSDHFVFPPNEHENLPLDESLCETEELRNTRFQDEQSIYVDSALGSSRDMESLGSESAMYEPNEFAEDDLYLHSDTATISLRLEKDASKSKHNLPCEAWWRRRAVSMYSSTREANAIWSLCFAAAVTGLVVFGQRWQQERWQVLQLKWQSSISSEKLSRVFEPLSRLKDVIVRGNPQASLVRSGSSEI